MIKSLIEWWLCWLHQSYDLPIQFLRDNIMGRVACVYSYTWLVRTCIHSVKCTCLYYVSKKSNLNLQNITNSSFSLIKIKEMTQCKTQTCMSTGLECSLLLVSHQRQMPSKPQLITGSGPSMHVLWVDGLYLLYPRYACLMAWATFQQKKSIVGRAPKKNWMTEKNIFYSSDV